MMVGMDARFHETLARAKARIGPVDFPWYPYDTLANLNHLEQLLGEELGSFLHRACPSRRVLDVGCGDGDLAFYLESLGYEVVAIDHPTHNHNGMQGVRAMRAALGSRMDLHEVDLDRQFRLPHDSYDAALFLGVLYHLRNPFFALEELAKRVTHCLVSTRVAQRFPDGGEMPHGVALAYLLQELELNADDSNYFIFSEPGLRVMLDRTWWQVRQWSHAGNAPGSDPIARDGRVFCQLESRYGKLADVQLDRGWHLVEGTGWRWTERSFSLVAGAGVGRRSLAMQLFLPAEHLAAVGPLQLSIQANGERLAPAVFESQGTHHLVRHFDGAETRFEFALNAAVVGNESDGRERGIIVVAVRVE